MPTKTHIEWFMASCYSRCECGSNKASRTKAAQDSLVYVWGKYHNAKWRRIMTVCEACFDAQVIPRLRAHATPCGCRFVLNARRGYSLAPWIRLPDDFNSCKAA